MEKRFPAESPPGLDFGASWARFWDRILQLLQEICGALGSFCDQRSFREPSKCEPPKRAALPVPCQIRFFLRAKTAPRRLQDGPRRAKMCQDAPRCAQEGPKTAQDASKTPQDAPKRPQGSENGGKMEEKWSQVGIKMEFNID